MTTVETAGEIVFESIWWFVFFVREWQNNVPGNNICSKKPDFFFLFLFSGLTWKLQLYINPGVMKEF